MKSFALVVATGLLFGVSQAFGIETASRLDAIVGTWQFPGKEVWIQVKKDGTAFQCRVDRDNTLIVSRGQFQSPDLIVWDAHWGTERVEYAAGAMTIHSKARSFRYIRARDSMTRECERKRDV